MMQAILDSPLLGLGLSAATFALGRWIQKKTGWTIANPLLISAVLSISLLLLLEIPYEAYAQGGEFINLMLSPVTGPFWHWGSTTSAPCSSAILCRCWWAAWWAAPPAF